MRPNVILFSSLSTLALVLAVSRARAAGCKEGDWFCDPSHPQAAEPAPGTAGATPPEAPPPPPARGRGRVRLQTEDGELPPPPPPPPPYDGRMVLSEPDMFPPPPPRARYRHFQPWGFGVHVFGALLGNAHAKSSNAGMGGLGFALRYRFIPEFALESDLEIGFGTDYNGYNRQETALLMHAVGILNPRSVVRLYGFGGFGLATARVDVGSYNNGPYVNAGYGNNGYYYPSYVTHHSYVGVDIGAGLEVRLSRHSSLNADVIGFVRDRVDGGRPEFVDPSNGRSTNTSGGGLIRAGAMFSW